MRYIVDFKDGASEADISAYFKANKCTVGSALTSLGHVYVVECATVPPLTEIVESVLDDAEKILHVNVRVLLDVNQLDWVLARHNALHLNHRAAEKA